MRLHISCQTLQWIELITHYTNAPCNFLVWNDSMFLLWPFRRNRFQWEHTSVLGLGDPEFWAATKATGISCQPLPTVGLLTEAATLQATPRRLIQPRLDGWSTNHNIQPFDSCNPSFALPYSPPFLFCLVCSEYVAIYFNVVGYWRLPRGCKFCCWGEARGWTEGAPSFLLSLYAD
jgi:hypothetical protein